tara:strand:- start:3428 stop:3853 length:426 start_codon:yes stop_codon:yes gene_type:complete
MSFRISSIAALVAIFLPTHASISGEITDFTVSQSNWLSIINGTFSGLLESDGSSVDVETTFNYFGREPFSGSYIYAESGKLVRGSLNNCDSKIKRYLSCTWSDKHGSGPLEIKFSQDLRSFHGNWAPSSNPDETFPWNGTR